MGDSYPYGFVEFNTPVFTPGNGKPVSVERKKEEKVGHVSDLVIPVVFLIIGCVIGMIYTGGFFQGKSFIDAFATSDASGTSWGTFGILIPIVVSCFQEVDPQLMIISISACMAGAVCGDHCSPISDTTIMSSAGAQCKHLNHVTTQLPYALTTAFVSFFTFLVAGFVKSALISLIFGIVMLFLILMFFRRRQLSLLNDAH